LDRMSVVDVSSTPSRGHNYLVLHYYIVGL
jgi:hypothetical protein